MARVTVEDCIEKVENRFDLVLMAAHRARMISSGAQITVSRDNDKNPVVALREIGDATISPEDLREDLIHSLQKYVEVDEPETSAAPMIESRITRRRGRSVTRRCKREEMARIPPSPRLSAFIISSTYLTVTTRMRDQKISDNTPRTAGSVSGKACSEKATRMV